MKGEKRFLVDVGIKDLPFPVKAISRANPDGQPTVALISISARIMSEFEPSWIDKFIRIVHRHRETIGPASLKKNIMDYLKELKATRIVAGFDYPVFVEKITPVSKEKCLVRYQCRFEAKVTSVEEIPAILFKIDIPVITTYPVSHPEKPGGLFGQISVITLEIEPKKDIYPEDLVELVDGCALAPVYSFLTEEDQLYIIKKIHSETKSSVVTTDEIKSALVRNKNIEWYSVHCTNFGMLHSYSTVIGTEKSSWVPYSTEEYEE